MAETAADSLTHQSSTVSHSQHQDQPAIARNPRKTIAQRHAKGLSLNFPILVATAVTAPDGLVSPSPTLGSATPIESAASSPRPIASPFKRESHAATNGAGSQGQTARSSADFLTLLAAQERKVLELKEELQRAEADLVSLKKQWAVYEANKKREEVRHVKRLQALTLDEVTGRPVDLEDEEAEEERRRRRALVERSNTTDTATVGDGSSKLGRKGSQRVFSGSRHTKTLSLLSPTVQKQLAARSAASGAETEDVLTEPLTTSLDAEVVKLARTRMPTLDDLVSGDHLQFGFGRTYKELAAHRRSLPPMAADLLVKQGKQVVDGVREGFWTFFEDLRQAAVGEEGMNGPVAPQRPAKPKPKSGSVKQVTTTRAKIRTAPDTPAATEQKKEPSFWKEFGLDTPQRPLNKDRAEPIGGHVQQKSSTDSTTPPSLLADAHDNEQGDDDGWGDWESPVSPKDDMVVGNNLVDGKPEAGDSLPWPELKKLTPTKLTRTVSDLMREWDATRPNEEGQGPPTNGAADGPEHLLL